MNVGSGVAEVFSAGGRRYDRDSDVSGSEALGAECWDLMSTLVERLYDPDEQVRWSLLEPATREGTGADTGGGWGRVLPCSFVG